MLSLPSKSFGESLFVCHSPSRVEWLQCYLSHKLLPNQRLISFFKLGFKMEFQVSLTLLGPGSKMSAWVDRGEGEEGGRVRKQKNIFYFISVKHRCPHTRVHYTQFTNNLTLLLPAILECSNSWRQLFFRLWHQTYSHCLWMPITSLFLNQFFCFFPAVFVCLFFCRIKSNGWSFQQISVSYFSQVSLPILTKQPPNLNT